MSWGWLGRLASWAGRARLTPGVTVPTSVRPIVHEPLQVVGQGGPLQGVSWTILAGPDPHRTDGMLTFVSRECAGYRARSGMGGPKLPHGRLLNTWHGTATGLPPFVLLRADPAVEAVTVHTAHGHHHRLELTDPVDGLGLRFAAHPLDEGDEPMELTAALADGSSFTSSYRTPQQPDSL